MTTKNLFFISCVFTGAIAKAIVLQTTGSYDMTPTDTKAEARAIAVEFAKQNALEQVGTVVTSNFEIIQDSSGKNEAKSNISTYAAGIMKTTILDTKYEGNTCLVSIETSIEDNDLKKYLEAPQGLQDKIHIVEKRNDMLEERLNLLLDQINKLNEDIASYNTPSLRSLYFKHVSNIESQIEQKRFQRNNILVELDKSREELKSYKIIEDSLYSDAMQSLHEFDKGKEYIDRVYVPYVYDNINVTLTRDSLNVRPDLNGQYATVKYKVHLALNKYGKNSFDISYISPELEKMIGFKLLSSKPYLGWYHFSSGDCKWRERSGRKEYYKVACGLKEYFYSKKVKVITRIKNTPYQQEFLENLSSFLGDREIVFNNIPIESLKDFKDIEFEYELL